MQETGMIVNISPDPDRIQGDTYKAMQRAHQGVTALVRNFDGRVPFSAGDGAGARMDVFLTRPVSRTAVETIQSAFGVRILGLNAE